MFTAAGTSPVNLYMSCSGTVDNSVGNCASAVPFFQRVADQGWPGLAQAQFIDYPDDNHGTVAEPTIQNAITAVFGTPP